MAVSRRTKASSDAGWFRKAAARPAVRIEIGVGLMCAKFAILARIRCGAGPRVAGVVGGRDYTAVVNRVVLGVGVRRPGSTRGISAQELCGGGVVPSILGVDEAGGWVGVLAGVLEGVDHGPARGR